MSSNGADAAMEHQPYTYRALESPQGTVRADDPTSLEAHLSSFPGTWHVRPEGGRFAARRAPDASTAGGESTIIRYISA